MTNKIQKIFFSPKERFEKMCLNIFEQIGTTDKVLKIAIFNAPANSEEYLSNLSLLESCAKDFFGDEAPLTAYVAQPCLTAEMAAEVTYMPAGVEYKRYNGYTLLHCDEFSELITKGITPSSPTATIRKQSEEIFAQLGEMLSTQGFAISDIYRQWNYIEQITAINDERQNYQEFNDARSRFYNLTEWSNGYPAATGIGISCGGVMIEAYAIKGRDIVNYAIDNPVQVSAHNYSQKVLTGKSDEAVRTTPKFERARIVGETVYISGTAAIKGENSLPLDNATAQTEETMQIIKSLTSVDNIPVGCNNVEYTLLRTYIKNKSEAAEVIAYMEKNYPSVPKHYLIADVCRPELLIEIEGTAITTVQG